MTLFKYEMKKLLLNKSRLILLAVLFILYALIGFGSSFGGEFEIEDGAREQAANSEFMSLVSENTGAYNPEQYEKSKAAREAAIAEYGTGEPLFYKINRDPELKFNSMYTAFGQKVDEYWNGPAEQKPDDIKGVYPMQEKLAQLEAHGQTNSYEYKLCQKRLNAEMAYGEPVFEYVRTWDHFFIAFDGMLIVLMFMLVLTFFISSLFTQEVKTEMDSIVLCSEKGRREIVTAKLLSAAAGSAVIALVYLVGWFSGVLAGCGNVGGLGAPARHLAVFQSTMIHTTVGGIVALSVAWLVFTSSVFGLVLSFVSSKMKNQSAAFGIGIVILLAGMASGALGRMRDIFWPVMDFNFGTLAMTPGIFGGGKMYNFFGTPISYGTAAFAASIALGAAACVLMYCSQRKRSAV